MNNFHRYLNLPFEISKPAVFDTTPNHVIHTQLDTHYDNNMKEFLQSRGLDILLIECFYTPPNGGKVPIHTDFWWYETDFVKINKTWGPEDGKIVWWNCSKTNEIILDHNTYENNDNKVTYSDYAKILTADENDCTEIFSANTNLPSLVNTGVLHSTVNPSQQGRWTLCFIPVHNKNTEEYVKWSDAIDIFKDVINE
jgi:hypothetical protein